jgi:hypothetical protein
MSKTKKSATQERLAKEETERKTKTAKQKADRLAAEAKNKDALEQSAKRVAALYRSMRECEADAEAKAGFELKKAAEKRAALEKALLEARVLCKAAGEDFKAFQEKYAPDYKRTRLYQVLSIADGRKTVEGIREEERDKKRRQRGRPGQSNVPDKAAERKTIDFPENGGGSQPVLMASAERPIEKVRDEFAALAGETPADDPPIGEAQQPVEPPSTNGHVNKPDDDRPLAEKLHYHLNDIWSLCQDANNWSHLSADQKVELRGAMTKLGYLRDLLPRLATSVEVEAALSRRS